MRNRLSIRRLSLTGIVAGIVAALYFQPYKTCSARGIQSGV